MKSTLQRCFFSFCLITLLTKANSQNTSTIEFSTVKTTEPQTKSSNVGTIIAVCIPLAILILLSFGIICWLRRFKRPPMRSIEQIPLPTIRSEIILSDDIPRQQKPEVNMRTI